LKPSGIILLDKPTDITSFQVLTPIKRALGHKKLGHTGTLDRFASGLLVLLAGSYTKLGAILTAWDKSYEAVFRLGEETETLDPEGAVLERAEVPTEERLVGEMGRFRGTIRQRPPAFSAVHVDGRRAHDRARAGEVVEMPEREVRIERFELLGFDGSDAHVRVDCSKGTYIRSLARDWARAAGSRAHVVELRRTRVGPFTVDDAVRPEDFAPERDLREDLSPLAGDLNLSEVPLGTRQGFLLGRAMNDAILSTPQVEDGVWALTEDGKLAAVAERDKSRWKFRFVVSGPGPD
jgi:tRNA pseudouridine55 synthase